MYNSAYGKTMKIKKKRVHLRVLVNANDYQRLLSQPSFVSQKIFNKNLTVLHKIKEVLTFK